MSAELLTLRTPEVETALDPGQGADVLTLVDRASGVDVLFRSPWRERADALRNGRPGAFSDPVAGWLERYRGGWQTLCPSAGQPRRVHGAPVGFHGELASVAWVVDSATTGTARLHTELFGVPLRVERLVELHGHVLTVTDVLVNLSDTDLEFDYSQHPALAGALLEGTCRIATSASRFVADPDTPGAVDPQQPYRWPHALSAGAPLDLSRVPAPPERRVLFGWLEGFDEAAWATVTNEELGLTVRLEWDGRLMPYAWFWQELNASEGFPWHRRARVLAIEPASMQTSGPGRRSVMRLGPHGRVSVPTSVGIKSEESR